MRAWLAQLQSYPGWKDWQRERFKNTLYFDDPVLPYNEKNLGDFEFSKDIDKQHKVIYEYIGLIQTLESLKQCEYYFRRYPFRGLPVSRSDHITNICEMYFSQFYEFRERLKKQLNAVSALAPADSVKVGPYIKIFDRVFKPELRERNRVHHHDRFSDIAIDQVFLMDTLSIGLVDDKGWKKEHLVAYRKVANEWVKRVRTRSRLLENLLEAIADTNLSNCTFLSDLVNQGSPKTESNTPT